MTQKQVMHNKHKQVCEMLQHPTHTLVMSNQGSTIGQLYTIHTATHKQAETECTEMRLFTGSARECTIYLQAMVDTLNLIRP